MFKHLSYSILLSLLLLIKALCMLTVILYAGIGLGPDEAQYWTWSQALDWGYYSKPPGIAWQIWLGTRLFGQTEIGVRFFAIALSFAQSLAVYYLALASGLQKKTAFWCGVIMALCPIGIFGSLFAITDGGFLLFWTLASGVVASALNQHRAPNPLIIGLCIFGGALFKWPIYIFWAFYLGCWFFFFREQKLPKKVMGFLGNGVTRILLGVGLSLCGLLPSFWWNWSHNWVTFRHVASTLQGGHGSSNGNPLEFLGSQALLFSPVLFILLVISFYRIRPYREMSKPLIFCLTVSLTSFLVVFCLSFFQKIQGNWVLFAYPTGIVFLGWYCCEYKEKMLTWLKIGLALSGVLVSLILLWPSSTRFYSSNPFKHNMGWDGLHQVLLLVGYDANRHFLVGDKYQTTSILSFYNPNQKRAYFLNLEGYRQNQFNYWPSLIEKEEGKTGYFIWIENTPHLQKNSETKRIFYLNELKKYFENVEAVGLFPLINAEGRIVKGAMVFKCEFCLNVKQIEATIY